MPIRFLNKPFKTRGYGSLQDSGVIPLIAVIKKAANWLLFPISFQITTETLNVQIGYVQRVGFDEITARLYFIAHQGGEQLIRSNRIIDGYPQHTA